MSRSNKKHHKVPATYLRAFVNSSGQLWVIDKEFKIYASKPENLLSETDYYTIRFPAGGGGTLEVETKYLNGIEGNYAAIYERIILNRREIDAETKAQLSIFVASMMERQQSRRESLKKFFNDVKKQVEYWKEAPAEAKKIFNSLPHDPSKSIPAEDILRMGQDVGSLHTSMIPDMVNFLAPVIFDMKWAFMVRRENSAPFITSDHPCHLINPIAEARFGPRTIGAAAGFAQKDVELSLPLSPNITLFCGWKMNRDCLYIPVEGKYVDDLNRRTQRGAQTLICSDKDVLTEMARKAQEYRLLQEKAT